MGLGRTVAQSELETLVETDLDIVRKLKVLVLQCQRHLEDFVHPELGKKTRPRRTIKADASVSLKEGHLHSGE